MQTKFDQIAKNHSSMIHNIEVQLGQLANAVATRGQGKLPSNTEANLKDVKAITLRSGKELKTEEELKDETKANEEKDTNTKEEDSTMEKVVEIYEAKVQSSSPPLALKISFPYRLKKQNKW